MIAGAFPPIAAEWDEQSRWDVYKQAPDTVVSVLASPLEHHRVREGRPSDRRRVTRGGKSTGTADADASARVNYRLTLMGVHPAA